MLPRWADHLLNARLLQVGGVAISLATLLTAAGIVLLTLWISKLLRRGIERALAHRGVDHGTSAAIRRLAHYLVLLVGVSMAVQTLGINLGALFAAGAIFAVALGFAMQNIVQNFVSGVILLVERSIKPGDVLAVDGQVVKVLAMRIRSTIAQTRDGEDLVLPNSMLVQSAVKNYTLKDSSYRVRTTVGVTYNSDMQLVERTLREVASGVGWRLPEHEPQVLMLEFGDNSVNFEVAVWMSDPWHARQVIGALNREIWNAFQQAQITIAFPQLDVHFDPTVSEGFERLAAVR